VINLIFIQTQYQPRTVLGRAKYQWGKYVNREDFIKCLQVGYMLAKWRTSCDTWTRLMHSVSKKQNRYLECTSKFSLNIAIDRE
jgi:hypothetical protein